MYQFIDQLKKCTLFSGLSEKKITYIFEEVGFNTAAYQKNSVVAMEGENCFSLGIILKGSVEIQRIYPSGKAVTIAQFTAGHIFGEAIIFSKDHRYPGTVLCLSDTRILYLKRDTVITLCKNHPIILENFLGLLSERILMLNRKIKEISLGTIRQKISHFLLEESKRQGTSLIKLSLSKEALAEHLGMQRPSLSRELIKMRNEGLIDFNKKSIKIFDTASLEESLL